MLGLLLGAFILGFLAYFIFSAWLLEHDYENHRKSKYNGWMEREHAAQEELKTLGHIRKTEGTNEYLR